MSVRSLEPSLMGGGLGDFMFARPDTDREGLNDSEEVNLASDGFGTNPLSVDTDGDGAWDNVDLDPLHNLVLAARVDRIHHGSAWWDPELVGVVRVNDDYTWVTEHRMASADGSDDHTATFYGTYYADVPDDRAVASVRTTAWSQNDQRGDDVLVDVTYSTLVNSGGFGTTVYNGNSWISFAFWTVALDKAKTFLVTGEDVTVTSASGVTRIAAQDRFFVLPLNVTSAAWPFVVGVNTVLVPRPVFLDSKLKADFDAGVFDPLPNADVFGNDLSKAPISAGVATTIAGRLRGDQAIDVLDRLLMNASGGWAHTNVDITGPVLVANLPADVVRIVPWASVTNGPTGDMPQDFWSKIGAVATTVVNALVYVGQMIYEGLVALGTSVITTRLAFVRRFSAR